MGEVVVLDGWTKLDIPVERVLTEAFKHGLQTVAVMGYDKDGELYFAASTGDLGKIVWMMEQSKRLMLRVSEEQ